MIIYKDIVYDVELFGETNRPKVEEGDETDCWCFDTKQIQQKSGDVDPSLLGANASAEEAAEETEESVTNGFDFELAHRLEKHTFNDGKHFVSWFKGYCKKVMKKVSADQEEAVKKSAMQFVKKFKGKFDNLDFYSGPSIEEDGDIVQGNMVIVDWNDDGVSGKAYCWRPAVRAEKF